MRVLASRYELHEPVGRGGMGEVWRGRDRELDRTVAVKMLPAELTRHAEFRARFRREARVAAALSHQGVAVLHDVGEDDGGGEPVPFLVMEFVQGATLADEVRGGPLAPDRAVGIARDIADTLVHSHGQGLVHRDIKPSNVMLTPTGGIKVLDFGIAKALADTATRLTSTGGVVGTPAYLSPEQIDGVDVDGRTDVYSLGCLLYELLTGRPPFTGDSPFAVMNQHLSKAPAAPSTLRPEVPAAVDAVVLRALAKRTDERYPDAATFRAALEHVQEAARQTVVGVPAPPPVSAAPTAHGYRPGPATPARPIPAQPAGPAQAPAAAAAHPFIPSAHPAPGLAGYPPPSGAPSAPPPGARAPRARFTPESVLALMGCLLVAYLQLTGPGTWFHTSLEGPSQIAWVAGLAALPWAPQVSAALVWGFAAFGTIDPAASTEQALVVGGLWAVAAAICLWLITTDAPKRGVLAVVAGWLLFRMGFEVWATHFAGEFEYVVVGAFWTMFVLVLASAAGVDVRDSRTRARTA